MADLPSIPDRLITAKPPESRVSPGAVAGPYMELADTLNAAAKETSAYAAREAEKAGLKAVTRDAEGNIQVEKAPIVGDAALAYQRAVKVAGVAAGEDVIKTDMLKMRHEFQNDPDGFRQAAENYSKEKVGQYEKVAGVEVGFSLGRIAADTSRQFHEGLLNKKEHNDLLRSHEAIDARLTSRSDDLEVLARNNGTGSPEFARTVSDINALLDEKVNNPLLHFPKEKADLYRENVMVRAHGAAVLNQTERIYEANGYEAARDYLRGTTRELGATLKQSDKIERAGMAWLRAEEAGFRGERDAIGRDWAVAKPQAATLPREALIGLRNDALKVGNHRVASDIDAHMQALDLVSDMRTMPASDKATVAVTGMLPRSLSEGQQRVLGSIEQEARRQGIDPKLATAIAWKESSLGIDNVATTSSARGIFQLTKANRERLGLPEGATVDDEVRAGVSFVKETIGELRNQLGREPTPAEIYMGHFQGAGAAAAIIRAAPDASLKETLDKVKPGWGDKVIAANPFLKDLPTVGAFRDWADKAMGGTGAAGGAVDLTQSRAGLLALGIMKKDLSKDITGEIANLREKVKKEEFPALDQVMSLGEKVYAIGTPEQKRDVSELVAIAKVGQQFMKLSAPQREQALSEANDDLKQASPRFDGHLRDALQGADKAINSAYKTDPYGAFYKYSRSEAAKPTPAMDFGNPSQMAAVSDFRVKQQNVIRAEEGLGPVSVFRPAEAEAFRGALAAADAKGAAGLFSVLGQLPDEVLGATLANADVKSAIQGATRTTDPAKYGVVMSSLDQLYARDPHRFVHLFGDDSWHALATWQSNLRYMDPKTLAAERSSAEDPQVATRRKVNEEKAQVDARKHSPEDIIKGFDTSWGITPGAIARNITGTQPLPPVDGGTRDALMGDYETIYKRRYAETLDKDVAQKQTMELLKTKWQRSDVNGGRLMLRAPETVYPAIDGSHGWMAPQVEADLEQRLGPRRGSAAQIAGSVAARAVGAVIPGAGAAVGAFGGNPAASNWDYTIVTDRQTETEAQRYDKAQPTGEANRVPTYQVVVRDNRLQNPQWKVLDRGDGRPLRYGFDPDIPRAASQSGMTIARDRNDAFLARHDVEAARSRRLSEGQ